MDVRRFVGGVLVVGLVSALAVEAAASPARRLARRGAVLPPSPAPAAAPSGPRRSSPLVVPLTPGGPAVVIGPGGRVRRRLVMPNDVGPGAAVAGRVPRAGSTSQAPFAKQPPAAPPAAPAVASSPSPAPPAARPAVPVESIPAPLPAPQPAAAGDVVPAGAELEIPDGTQSVLVRPAAP